MLVIVTAFMLFGLFGLYRIGPNFEIVRFKQLWCTFGVIFFGVYIVIDTQMIAKGDRYSLSLDDYVVGALMLYIDIIGLFIYLLRLLGKENRLTIPNISNWV